MPPDPQRERRLILDAVARIVAGRKPRKNRRQPPARPTLKVFRPEK
jgi:hypothetical protein